MNEPRLPALIKDRDLQVFRLTILPTWGNPIAVRVQRTDDKYLIFSRRLDGEGGYNPGRLVEGNDSLLTKADSIRLNSFLSRLNFFQLPVKDEVYGQDGDTWILEGVAGGRYHVITRWCPSTIDPTKRDLE